MTTLPVALTTLVDELAAMRGVVAVVLGGSRVDGTGDARSDWDLGAYYRGDVDLTALARRGVVHPPGSWGRIMNGGAWLRVGGERVDVLLRDLDAVEHWTRRAHDGDFEVDALLGYVAGAPTYLLAAEMASCRVLRGDLPTIAYPPALAAAAPPRWHFCRSFSLAYARVHAQRGDVVGAVGQAAKAVMEEAHAVMSARRVWVCNEKRLVASAGLGAAQALFTRAPSAPVAWVAEVAERLGAAKDEVAPWEAT